MAYWLLKTEPSEFSAADLAASRNATTCWDGVRNFQARNFMRDQMRKGDLAFLYHSSCPAPGIAAIVEVVREAYPDHTAFDATDKHFDPKSDPDNPRWYMVDVRLKKIFERLIPLSELREHAEGALRDMLILRRGNRLSVTPVTKEQWEYILTLTD
jgi:predicted RNA-binding protein with PUA-like domain